MRSHYILHGVRWGRVVALIVIGVLLWYVYDLSHPITQAFPYFPIHPEWFPVKGKTNDIIAVDDNINARHHISKLVLLTQPIDPTLSQPSVPINEPNDGCYAHSPGRVLIRDNDDHTVLCYGSTSLKDTRICDTGVPDFTQSLMKGNDWLTHVVREQTYLIRPFYHTSMATAHYREKDLKSSQARQTHVSLATQGSWNRIEHIKPLAERWRGPVSVALLLDSDDQIAILERTIESTPIIQQYVDIHLVLRRPIEHKNITGCGSPLSLYERKAFLDEGYEFPDDVTIWGGQYLYKCQPTCVGHGGSLEDCPKQDVVCSGFNQYGPLPEQFLSLLEAIRMDHYRHPRCPMKDNHYPVNMLRNIALQNIPTSLVMVVDIDNMPSGCMAVFAKSVGEAEYALAQQSFAEGVCPGLYAFIPPAVEMQPETLQKMKLSQDKEQCNVIERRELVKAMMKKEAQPMHMYFPPAYMPTNHLFWAQATSPRIYEVLYTMRFEPYYVARTPIPMFADKFVDRGGNFAQQTLEMHAGGYRFFVLSDVFLVDIPHNATGISQSEDNQRMSNALWRAFYLSLIDRYGQQLQPYKGAWYTEMRKYLDKMVDTYTY
eukprot:Ihof_evm4s177 gene=Ihof_evmTU4s177